MSFSLEIIKIEDLEEVSPVAIDVYTEGEPVAVCIKATPDDMREYLKPGVIHWINSGYSVKAVDNETGKIAGVMLCHILTKGNLLSFGNLPANTEKSRFYKEITIEIESRCDPFKEGVNKVLEQALLAVRPEYRGKGIGRMMAQKCQVLGLEAGCELSMVSASNIATKKIFEKLGYSVFNFFPYNEFRVDGKAVIDESLSNGSIGIYVMTKPLN